MKRIFSYALFILIACLALVALQYFNDAQEDSKENRCRLEGKVIRIADGDSITVLDSENTQHKIRLAGIDAPEHKQPYGKAARQFLAKEIFKKSVCVGWYKRDKYQRLVGIVWFNDEDINLKLVAAGLSWHYKQYQDEQSSANQRRYADAQDTAEDNKRGLWRERSPIPPWLWRRGER